MGRRCGHQRANFTRCAILSLCALLFACPVKTENAAKKASLSITLALPARPRTLLPTLDMVPASFAVVCLGPAGERAEAATSQTTVRIEGLALGTWTVTVSAQNQGGTIIAEGSKSVQLLEEGDTEVTIPVEPLAGNGSLELTAQWLASSVPLPTITAALQPSTGDSIPLAFSIDGAAGTCAKHNLLSGYYTLQIALLSAGSLVAGATDVVRILKDQTTTGVFDFTDLASVQGTVRVTIAPQLDDPLATEIAGRQGEMGLGQSIVLKPWLAEECIGGKSSWYVDGSKRSAEGTVSLGADLSLGVHRIDLTVFSPDGRRAGSSSFRVRVLAPFPRGSLSLSAFFKDGTAGVDGLNGCRSVAVSPDDSSLYAAGYGDAAIAWFARDAQTGALRFKGQCKNGVGGVCGLAGAESIALSPDGALLFATGYTDNSLAIFSRNAGTGALTYIGFLKNGEQGLDGLAGAKGLGVSSDGKNVYCTGYTSGTLLVFALAPSNGNLTLIQSLRDGEGGITVLGGASSVAVAPDGSQVFVASYNDDSLVAFNRDASSGLLSVSQVFTDGQAGCDGLNGANCVGVSPDGRSLYVTGYYDNALAVFSRDPVSGTVSFSSFFKDGIGGVDGLYYARGVVVSPDGLSVYATGSADDAVAFFERNPTTGGLSFHSFANQIDGARGIAVSEDGRNCYVASSGANGVTVLNRARE